MAHIFSDRVRQTSLTGGTGTLTLSADAVNGFRRFSDVLATNDTCDYYVTQGANWETGIGTLASATALARTQVLASSNGGAAVNFAASIKDVGMTILGTRWRDATIGNRGLIFDCHMSN